MSSKAAAAQNALLQAVKTLFCVYIGDFQNLPVMQEPQCGDDLAGSIALMLWGRPYMVRRRLDLQTRDHDVINRMNVDLYFKFGENR